MSYALRPFAVSIAAVRAALGSRDDRLAEAVAGGAPQVDLLPLGDDDLPLADAVRHLVLGAPRRPDGGHVYRYALLQICSHLGRELPARLWNGVRLAALEDSGVEEVAFAAGQPFDVPHDGDFPLVGALAAPRIASLLGREAGTAGPRVDDPDLRQMRDEFDGWLRTAAGEGSDLVLFVH